MRCDDLGNRGLPVGAWLLVLLGLAATSAHAATPPCNPCAGISVAAVEEWLEPLAAAPALEDEARLYVAWAADPGSATAAALTREVARRGAVPWLRVAFATPPPLDANLAALEEELAGLSALARAAAPETHFQIEWRTDWQSAAGTTADYGFLFKRAAVAVTGARSDAPVITEAVAGGAGIAALYDLEIAAYADGIALLPASTAATRDAIAKVNELDPGKPVVVMEEPAPRPATRALVAAASGAADGVSVTFFAVEEPAAETLAPLKVLAREFQGADLSYDPYSAPPGNVAWAFVRGEDLALRVIVDRAGGRDRIEFADTTLRRPMQVDPATGTASELFGIGRTADGLVIPLEGDGDSAILRLSRPDLAEMVGEGGLAEEVTITTERTMPVAEILRRLQANEDARDRAFAHYEGVNTTHLRFQGGGAQQVEATFEGPIFLERGKPYDWVWRSFYVNGIRWRGKRIPDIPLVEPEKAATLPLAITFDRDYTYRLRGTDVVDGRDCWVVDFRPTGEEGEGNRYQGTVWIDRALFLRVKSRALQLGLSGEVLSNEETQFFTPLDAAGAPAPWEGAVFTLPLRIVSQQLFSVLNASLNVEKETLVSELRVNAEGFESRRLAAWESELTMVRDTDDGLRYLVADDETGERLVQEEFDKDRLFLVGGLLYDESLDYPLPLAGINYFSFDFRDTGAQVNLLFAGVLAIGNIADPELLGSRWDAGANLLGVAIPFTNSIYRDGEKAPAEDLDVQFARVGFSLGRPVGSFTKLGFDYELGLRNYSRATDTAEEFVLPEDQLIHSLGLNAAYSRRGYRLRLGARFSKRSDWKPWGLPGEPFDPKAEEFGRWSASLAKTLSLSGFKKVGLQVEYLDGANLDRFSKYEFGFFDDSRVHGYESGIVQAEKAYGLHGTYGFELGELFRLELIGDAIWATDEATALDRELLAGAGIAGTFIGPWQTIVNLDFGVPVAGPDDDGFTLFLAFLKLFK
ncbi:MAG: hypothetical protein OES32_05095 [Acidobacteriota bacterium]|nr:hypothetical protein [Acidobacteriota bacterium]